MIRRWSHIIYININFNKNLIFKKKFNLNLFRLAVRFKRFTFSYTKLKRKSLIRIKHKNNFIIYTSVLKLWVKHYLFNKNYLKFQFFNKIFINNYYFFNLSFIKIKNNEIKNNFNFVFFNFINKNFNYINKINLNKFFNHLPLSIAFSPFIINKDNTIYPISNLYDSIFYNIFNIFSELNIFTTILEFFFYLIIKKITEIKKILILLFFFKINFTKVK
jgi:hypothetical protein